MLTSKEILRQINYGNIVIDNLSKNALEKQNSCNVTLGDTLYFFENDFVDTKNSDFYFKNFMEDDFSCLKRVKINNGGFCLNPNITYLAKTEERVKTKGYVPVLNGCNSLSILGVSVLFNNEHKKDYYDDSLLLCIKCTKPTIIYPNMKIGNLAFYRSLEYASSFIGMLSGEEIKKRMDIQDIIIYPQDNIVINPNSVNLSLSKMIGYYPDPVLDTRDSNRIETLEIDEKGLILNPNEIYIARTNEWTETNNLIPMISGRSSLGRLGYHAHCSAAMGSIGYKGYWHMGLRLTNKLRVYENMKCGQLYYFTPVGEIDSVYDGKFQDLKYDDFEYYQKILCKKTC